MTKLKTPKKGAGERLRDFYNKNLRNQPMSSELKEILKKKDAEKSDSNKKSATPRRDMEQP